MAHALERFRTGAPVGDVVGETGYSHRHFIHLFAFEAGYSDQAHLTREFHELAGLTPGEYRRSESRRPGHVAIR